MKRQKIFCVMMGSVLAFCMSVSAQEKGNWRAADSMAQSITGDVTLSGEKISIDFSNFAIARIRDLKPEELSAAFDADSDSAGTGSLYKLNIPASKIFRRHNTLCGTEDTQWMATYVTGHSLHLLFFSGSAMPVFTPDTIGNSTDLCGSFSYVR